MKLDLLTNATVIEDAIRFVSEKSKEQLKLSCGSKENDNGSMEPDYHDNYNKQREEKQEEKTGDITINCHGSTVP